jgi:phosphatidylserine/phosphatidylglycerophosphate/cardiolipin synthase-like enzyme
MVGYRGGGEECVSIFAVCHHSFHLINGYRYVSELLYIHTKLMIVDDRKVIVSVSLRCSIYLFTGLQMGSANLNDRSQKVSFSCVLLHRYHLDKMRI